MEGVGVRNKLRLVLSHSYQSTCPIIHLDTLFFSFSLALCPWPTHPASSKLRHTHHSLGLYLVWFKINEAIKGKRCYHQSFLHPSLHSMAIPASPWLLTTRGKDVFLRHQEAASVLLCIDWKYAYISYYSRTFFTGICRISNKVYWVY